MNAKAQIKTFGELFDEHIANHLAKYVVSLGFSLLFLGIWNKVDIHDMKRDIKDAVPRLIYDVNISNLNQRVDMNKEDIERLQKLWDERYSTDKNRGNESLIPYKYDMK